MNQRWLVDQTEWRAPCPRIVSAKRHHYSWWWGSSPTGGSSLLNWRELYSHSWTSDLLTPRSQVYPKQPRLISLPVGSSFIINVCECVRAFLPFISLIETPSVVSGFGDAQVSKRFTWNNLSRVIYSQSWKWNSSFLAESISQNVWLLGYSLMVHQFTR